METCSSDPTTEKRVRNAPLTISNMLVFNEPRRPTDREPLRHKGLTPGNGSKYTEQSLSDEELFDTEDLEHNSPIDQFEPRSEGFIKIGVRTLYQA
ncbi:hypothetical protein K7432_012874 [Basidiobolus ranarum]|uniref:Uncharacterized protein n=1 Tax=Basidiobolus ranarum TaxID=34480 RepID=A0ABR2VRL8_9FUNG